MKVVLAHKFSHLVGGAEEYIRQQHQLMIHHGHQVVPYAQRQLGADPTPFDQYFLSPLELRSTSWPYKLAHLGRILSRTLYSLEARRTVGALVDDQRPDVAHIHAIENHISPAILDELRARGVPIVQSVNNYKQICTSYRLYLLDRQEVCERCRRGRYYPAVQTRCVKGSFFASVLGMLEMYLHHSVLDIYQKVDRFVVPNEFVASKMIDAGHEPEKLVRLRNPFDLAETTPSEELGDFILYFGRIEPEKGVLCLIKAMQRMPNVRLVIVGDGQQEAYCRAWIRDHRVENVTFHGPKWGAELQPYLEACRMVVVPSVWFEPSPYVIYQALAAGKPVIGSAIGGIPDLINEETGRLVAPGDDEALADAIASIVDDDAQLRDMGKAARRWAETHLDPDIYYQGIMEVYETLCGRSLR